ncbi:hypothetical protein RINTHH_16540 [Richelia intracellularis HH01]|uniref:Uncharacterized protein n=1 Tax=Richelia intracellularis HH01 TaxID=1165094 RepID=M1WT54_9NOST|nr:hypothetical protein RINTHH_16540 [Richelia intracellularis HH01]
MPSFMQRHENAQVLGHTWSLLRILSSAPITRANSHVVIASIAHLVFAPACLRYPLKLVGALLTTRHGVSSPSGMTAPIQAATSVPDSNSTCSSCPIWFPTWLCIPHTSCTTIRRGQSWLAHTMHQSILEKMFDLCALLTKDRNRAHLRLPGMRAPLLAERSIRSAHRPVPCHLAQHRE